MLLPNERLINVPWLLDFEREILAVPGGKHDDQVDALVLALSRARRSALAFEPFYLSAFDDAVESGIAHNRQEHWGF